MNLTLSFSFFVRTEELEFLTPSDSSFVGWDWLFEDSIHPRLCNQIFMLFHSLSSQNINIIFDQQVEIWVIWIWNLDSFIRNRHWNLFTTLLSNTKLIEASVKKLMLSPLTLSCMVKFILTLRSCNIDQGRMKDVSHTWRFFFFFFFLTQSSWLQNQYIVLIYISISSSEVVLCCGIR